MLDYELMIWIDNKWKRLKRVYGIHKLKDPHFIDPSGNEIKIDLTNSLIYRKGKPVEYGKPLHGWVAFAGDPELHNANISMYRLTCVDAFKRRSSMVTTPDNFANLLLLQELANVEIPKSAQKNPS